MTDEAVVAGGSALSILGANPPLGEEVEVSKDVVCTQGEAEGQTSRSQAGLQLLM